jgi:type II secretion system protein H
MNKARLSVLSGRGRGFSLIEIMVVCVLIAIMAGAIIPRFGGHERRKRLESAATLMSGAFRYCYSQAVATGLRHRWQWDSDAERSRFLIEGDPGEKPGEFTAVSAGGRQSEALPQGIELEGVYFAVKKSEDEEGEEPELPPEITFYPDGHCDSTYVVLRIADPAQEEGEESSGEARTVALNGVTGRVKVLKGNAVAAMSDPDAEYKPGESPHFLQRVEEDF